MVLLFFNIIIVTVVVLFTISSIIHSRMLNNRKLEHGRRQGRSSVGRSILVVDGRLGFMGLILGICPSLQ